MGRKVIRNNISNQHRTVCINRELSDHDWSNGTNSNQQLYYIKIYKYYKRWRKLKKKVLTNKIIYDKIYLENKERGKKMKENEIEKIWDYLVESEIATEEEINLITCINGYSVETLNDVIYARTGYRSLDQLIDDEN